MCIFKRRDTEKYLIGKIVQFSYLMGNKRERQYSSNYIDMSKDSFKSIGTFANWFMARSGANDFVTFQMLDSIFTIGYIPMEKFICKIDEILLNKSSDSSFSSPPRCSTKFCHIGGYLLPITLSSCRRSKKVMLLYLYSYMFILSQLYLCFMNYCPYRHTYLSHNWLNKQRKVTEPDSFGENFSLVHMPRKMNFFYLLSKLNG